LTCACRFLELMDYPTVGRIRVRADGGQPVEPAGVRAGGNGWIMMCNLLTIIGLWLAGPVGLPGEGVTPQPALAPASWELRFRFHDPARVSVVLPDQAEPVVYWYVLYSIENPTDREVDFYPRFEIVTDTLKVVPAEVGVSPYAFKAVFDRARNPLLIPPEQVTGKILRGEDQIRHSVALFRDFDPKAKSFTVYVGGLSGEIIRWRNPAFDESQPENGTNPRYFLLRKTLAVPYQLAGSEASRPKAVPRRIPEKQSWVMR